MSAFGFYHPIFVRYGDLDPQGHVNNARYLTYLEHARVSYLQSLGLWDGKDFYQVGIIIARAEIHFTAPIRMEHDLRVGVKITRLGEKSMEMEYILDEKHTRKIFAEASTTLVAYDYPSERSISVPTQWREIIASHEDIPPKIT